MIDPTEEIYYRITVSVSVARGENQRLYERSKTVHGAILDMARVQLRQEIIHELDSKNLLFGSTLGPLQIRQVRVPDRFGRPTEGT